MDAVVALTTRTRRRRTVAALTDGEPEQPQHAGHQLALGARRVRAGVVVDDLAEDDRVDA
jgi:hypothetical protein